MILPKMLEHLKNMTSKGVIVTVTSDANNHWLNRMVESCSNIVLTIKDDKEIVRITLEKHPSQRNGSAELKLKQELPPTKPMTMESWL